MKAIITLLFFITTSSMNAQQIKVMSYNIRLDVKSDGENNWMYRKEKVAALMNYYEADFIGAQEVQHHQLFYLDSQLTKYDYIGVGRDDGKSGGEYACIFYNKEKYKCLQSATIWLSESRDTASKGWDAALPRICTYGLFQIKSSKKKIGVFNTHLDHVGKTARLESVKLISKIVQELAATKKIPIIITGDFNSKPDEAPYQYFASQFSNTRNISNQQPYGTPDTWNGFHFFEKPQGCIDYIFINKHPKIKVDQFATLTDSYDLKYPSDHFPVMATLFLKK